MDFAEASADLEELLKSFLVGTYNLTLDGQILDIRRLPVACRDRVQAAQSMGRAWTAWTTERGPVAAWCAYDLEGSKRLKAHVLYVEWCMPPCEYHAVWCRCYPNRPTEWIFGRGVSGETR